MRGKLRDKRATNKRDIPKPAVLERRRSAKRDNRPLTQLEQFEEDNYELEIAEEAEQEVAAPTQK